MMSPEIVNAIVAEEALRDALKARHLDTLWWPFPAWRPGAGSALVRIVQRYASGRNHNFHNTVVEEILRQFYAANAGGPVDRNEEGNGRHVPIQSGDVSSLSARSVWPNPRKPRAAAGLPEGYLADRALPS